MSCVMCPELLKVIFFMWSEFPFIKFCTEVCAEVALKYIYNLKKLCQSVPWILKSACFVSFLFKSKKFVTYHMSHATCYFFILSEKVVNLVSGGSVINGLPRLVYNHNKKKTKENQLVQNFSIHVSSAAKQKIRQRNLKLRLLSDQISTKNQTKNGPKLHIWGQNQTSFKT